MNLPSKHSNTGRVLRAMHGAGPMTAEAIRRKANFSTDTEITARIRDIRKLGCSVACYNVPQGDGKQIWLYRIDYMPRLIREALHKEMISCTRPELTLEPMTHDTWHRPEKRIRNDAPFVVGDSL